MGPKYNVKKPSKRNGNKHHRFKHSKFPHDSVVFMEIRSRQARVTVALGRGLAKEKSQNWLTVDGKRLT